MNRRLVLRMWLYRMGRIYERWLKLATGAGFGGLVLTAMLYSLAPDLGHDWQLVCMGFSLILAGLGHALLGESTSLEQYATGKSEEMPSIAKLVSGLLASSGGLLIAGMGLVQVLA